MYGTSDTTEADMTKKPIKSESMSIRVDPKVRFVLEFISRLKGQSITTVVERAIHDAGRAATISRDHGLDEDWTDFWAVSDGVRALAIAREPALFPSYEEEKRLHFVREHWPFFYLNSKKDEYDLVRLDNLWPKIDHYIEKHDSTRSSDYFAAGKEMNADLKAAGLPQPMWPQASDKNLNHPKPEVKKPERDLDDEIPF
jgi:hypothetical protein